MLVSVGPYKLALGLEWGMALHKGEVRQKLKEMGSGPVVVLPDESGHLFVGHYPHGSAKGAYAGAALMALVVPNGIICQTVGENATWICVIQDGRPIPNQEYLLDSAQAREQVSNLLAMYRHPLYGDRTGAESSVEDLVQRLHEAVGAKQIKKQALRICELRAQGISFGAVMLVVALAAGAAGSVIAYRQWEQWQLAEKARAINAQKARAANMTAEQLEAERRRLIAEFHQAVAVRRAQVWAAAVPGQPAHLFASANHVRRQLPLSNRGYIPSSVTCVPTACTVSWEGQGRFSLASDKDAIAGASNMDLAKAVTVNVPLVQPAISGSALLPASPAQLRVLLSESLSRIDGTAVDDLKPIVVTPPPNLGLQPVTVGYEGAFRVHPKGGAALISAQSAVDILSRFPVVLSKVVFTEIRRNLGVSVEGTYTIPHNE